MSSSPSVRSGVDRFVVVQRRTQPISRHNAKRKAAGQQHVRGLLRRARAGVSGRRALRRLVPLSLLRHDALGAARSVGMPQAHARVVCATLQLALAAARRVPGARAVRRWRALQRHVQRSLLQLERDSSRPGPVRPGRRRRRRQHMRGVQGRVGRGARARQMSAGLLLHGRVQQPLLRSHHIPQEENAAAAVAAQSVRLSIVAAAAAAAND